MGPKDDSFVLATVVNSAVDIKDITIDGTSTAIALVFMNPLIGSGNSNPNIISIISKNVDVLAFAREMDRLDSLTINDLDKGGRLFNVFVKASTSVVNSLNSTKSTTPNVIKFTAIVSSGYYAKAQLIAPVTSVLPASIPAVYVKEIKNRVFVITDETKFLKGSRPTGTTTVDFKSAAVVGYYDIRRAMLIVESVSSVQL